MCSCAARRKLLRFFPSYPKLKWGRHFEFFARFYSKIFPSVRVYTIFCFFNPSPSRNWSSLVLTFFSAKKMAGRISQENFKHSLVKQGSTTPYLTMGNIFSHQFEQMSKFVLFILRGSSTFFRTVFSLVQSTDQRYNLFLSPFSIMET